MAGRYTLPELPYDYAALEPHLIGEIVELHHDKHHKTYVDGANAALDALEDARGRDDAQAVAALDEALAFHVSGHVLHSIYWRNMTPGASGRPEGELALAIEEQLGGFPAMRKQMIQTASTIKGSGWSVLAWDPIGKALVVWQVHDHQSSVTQGGVPLLALDVWEHAYYLQYQTDKARYFDAMFALWNWEDVARRWAAACSLDLAIPDTSERGALRAA